MRHLRMPNQNLKNLSTFKKQIGSILREINKFDEAEKTEALTYLRQCIDSDACTSTSDKSKSSKDRVEGPLKKRKNKLIEYNEQNTREAKKSKQFGRHKTLQKNLKKSIKFRENKPSVKPVLLKCRQCSETRKTKRLLLKHLETHVGTPITCIKCKRTFNSKLSFDWHLTQFCKLKKVVADKKFKCTECTMKFGFKRHLDRHLEGHKRNNCNYCGMVLTKRKQLTTHMLEVHSIKLDTALHKCEHCEKKFVKKRSLYYHMRQHSVGKFVCMECGVISNSYTEYNDHILKHEEQKPFKCPRCNDRFSRRQQYLYHLKRHDRYKCVTCNETYALKARAIRHRQRGHQVEGLHPTMECPYCPAAFHRKLSLQMHMRKHSDDKPTINCKYCDKTFQSPYAYYKHCMTANHEKQSPETSQLVCENCGKQFTKKYLLEQHLQRVHNLEKQPHSCEYCDYKTHNKTNMKRHVSLHLSHEKEFICDQCGKTFSSITSLKDHVSHMHTYSQEKNFKCEQCDKSFKRNSELVRHRATHSNIRPFVCTVCNMSYKRNTHLKRHEETVHKKVSKKKRVQRLKVDKNGELVPVPNEKKIKEKSKVPIEEQQSTDTFITTTQPVEYFKIIPNNDTPIKNVTSSLTMIDQNIYNNQQTYWSDKYAVNNGSLLSNAPNMTTAQNNELVALNIVDQLVNSFLPDKGMNVAHEGFYTNYSDATEYNNVVLSSVETDASEILTTTEKILQDQSDRDFMMEPTVSDYVQNFHYMQ